MYGHRIRGNLQAKAHLFKRPALLTLTVDRDGTKTGRGFESPQRAHDFVTSNRLIAVLMRQLGIQRWVWVVESQENSGDGWPHWHVLIDLSAFRDGRLPLDLLKLAWSFWRDRRRVGMIDLQAGEKFKGAGHAINYITKYLTKYPRRGFPRWVIESTRLRFCASSRAVGALVADGDAKRSEGDEEERQRAEASRIIDRMATCGQRTMIMREGVDSATGEARRVFVAMVQASPADLHYASLQPRAPLLVRLEREAFGYTRKDGRVISGERDTYRLDWGDPERVTAWLEREGLMERWRERVDERRRVYLDRWKMSG